MLAFAPLLFLLHSTAASAQQKKESVVVTIDSVSFMVNDKTFDLAEWFTLTADSVYATIPQWAGSGSYCMGNEDTAFVYKGCGMFCYYFTERTRGRLIPVCARNRLGVIEIRAVRNVLAQN